MSKQQNLSDDNNIVRFYHFGRGGAILLVPVGKGNQKGVRRFNVQKNIGNADHFCLFVYVYF
jgi:hypothetical protein